MVKYGFLVGIQEFGITVTVFSAGTEFGGDFELGGSGACCKQQQDAANRMRS